MASPVAHVTINIDMPRMLAAVLGPSYDGLEPSRLEWLSALLSEIEVKWAWEREEDPEAIRECIYHVRAMAEDLRTELESAQVAARQTTRGEK